MKTRGNLKHLCTKTILGKRVQISEFKNVRFYRLGTCNIQASSIDEAIEKYVACREKSNVN